MNILKNEVLILYCYQFRRQSGHLAYNQNYVDFNKMTKDRSEVGSFAYWYVLCLLTSWFPVTTSESPSTSKKGVTVGFSAKANKSASFPCDFTQCTALKGGLECLYAREYDLYELFLFKCLMFNCSLFCGHHSC